MGAITDPGGAGGGRGRPSCARRPRARRRSRGARPHTARRAHTDAAQTRCTPPHSPCAGRTRPRPRPRGRPPRPFRAHSFTHSRTPSHTQISSLHRLLIQKNEKKEMQGSAERKKVERKRNTKGKRCSSLPRPLPPLLHQLRGFFQKEIKSVAKPAAALYADVMKLNFWKRDGRLEYDERRLPRLSVPFQPM